MAATFRRITLVALAVAIVLAIAWALRPRPVDVDIAMVKRGSMAITVEEEGVTRISERYVVSSPLAGRLRRLTLDPGDSVRAGETVIAVIDPADPELLDPRAIAQAEARVRAAEAALERARAMRERAQTAYNLAETELGRLANAREDGAANEQELVRAEAAERSAADALRAASFEADIAVYELEVARAALLLSRGEPIEGDTPRVGSLTLTSPIDGVVLRVEEESVRVVAAGDALVEVGDLSDLEVVIDVLSSDAVAIEPGARVAITDWGGAGTLEAIVRLVEPSGFTHVSALGIEEQRVNVIADFITPRQDRLTLGDHFRVEASIVVWEVDDALVIPATSAFRREDGWAVYVIEGRGTEGTARLTSVTLGQRNAESMQVLDGLSEGQQIVRYPGDGLTDGVRVRQRTY
ncbi:MAG: HlyD family efflux transporter periplasmic adaptor subunit [Phycisphaerales bacterium]